MYRLRFGVAKAARHLAGPGRFLLPVALLVVGPLRPAHAYVDPNVAGPLYQMLLPLLIAISSALAMVRRYLRHLWDRSIEACVALLRRKPRSGPGKQPL
jgi:hypothetical protein